MTKKTEAHWQYNIDNDTDKQIANDEYNSASLIPPGGIRPYRSLGVEEAKTADEEYRLTPGKELGPQNKTDVLNQAQRVLSSLPEQIRPRNDADDNWFRMTIIELEALREVYGRKGKRDRAIPWEYGTVVHILQELKSLEEQFNQLV